MAIALKPLRPNRTIQALCPGITLEPDTRCPVDSLESDLPLRPGIALGPLVAGRANASGITLKTAIPNTLQALVARRSLPARKTLNALRTLGALPALEALDALTTLIALGAPSSLIALGTLSAIGSGGSLPALKPIWPLGSDASLQPICALMANGPLKTDSCGSVAPLAPVGPDKPLRPLPSDRPLKAGALPSLIALRANRPRALGADNPLVPDVALLAKLALPALAALGSLQSLRPDRPGGATRRTLGAWRSGGAAATPLRPLGTCCSLSVWRRVWKGVPVFGKLLAVGTRHPLAEAVPLATQLNAADEVGKRVRDGRRINGDIGPAVALHTIDYRPDSDRLSYLLKVELLDYFVNEHDAS